MALIKLLGVRPGVTAVIGSGGKTTLLRTLGAELAANGHTVVLCTTTKIFPFEEFVNLTGSDEGVVSKALNRYGVVCVGTSLPNEGKLTAPHLSMERLAALAEYVLVEADGAHHLPLKAHETWEPVIPECAGHVICVAGMSGIGKPIAESAHRSRRYAELAGVAEETVVTPELAGRVLNKEHLGDLVLLNQADELSRAALARELAGVLTMPAVYGSLLKGELELC